MLAYDNRSRTAVRIGLGTLTMTGPAGQAMVMSAADVTDTDLMDARTDNDDARVVLQRNRDGAIEGGLELPAGARRSSTCSSAPFRTRPPSRQGTR